MSLPPIEADLQYVPSTSCFHGLVILYPTLNQDWLIKDITTVTSVSLGSLTLWKASCHAVRNRSQLGGVALQRSKSSCQLPTLTSSWTYILKSQAFLVETAVPCGSSENKFPLSYLLTRKPTSEHSSMAAFKTLIHRDNAG